MAKIEKYQAHTYMMYDNIHNITLWLLFVKLIFIFFANHEIRNSKISKNGTIY